MDRIITIGDREVGAGRKVFVSAEIGINHNGDLDLAIRMIQAAAEAGADAVKFQAFRADSFVSKSIGKASHQEETLEEEDSVYAMWKRLEFSIDDFERLQEEATKLGLIFFSSAFDDTSLELLDSLDTPVHKIASGDITHLPFVEKVGRLGKPVIMSVGMATLVEIGRAIEAITSSGNWQIVLLQCTSEYPTTAENVNLLKIPRLKETFSLPVGFSDHTTSLWAPAAAVALGACFVERHFTLDKGLPGSDQAMSADPTEMAQIVEGIGYMKSALGNSEIGPAEIEREGRTLFRRSLIAATDIAEGTVITADHIIAKRPATGIAPEHLHAVIGRVAKHDIAADEPIHWDAI